MRSDERLKMGRQAVLLLDQADRILFADPAAAALLCTDADQLTGEPAARFLPEEILAAPGSLLQCETAVIDAQNRSFPAAISVHMLDPSASAHRMISIMNAIDTLPLSDKLFHTQRLAGVGTLTASVAHELTNPLSIITATCSNLLHEVKSNNLDADMLMHYIQMIEQSAWRSARMIEVLRHYAHDNGLQAAVTSLNMIVEDALTLVRAQFIKEYNIHIETQLDESLKSIVCDHNRLTQVLINLLVNARDAMQPHGGTVTIRTWMASDPDGRLRNGSRPADMLAFSVSDEGTGIPDELVERVYEPFFTTKPSGSGTGLGLFIAREIVEEHNGRISAVNNPDGGATFTVLLPQRS